MSNAFSVNAVTTTLTQLLTTQLSDVLGGGPVTSRPLDKAREPTSLTNQLNLFLWGISPNAALRNQPMPGVRAGETATLPLALDLHYLLTAYGRDDDINEAFSHVILGHAMRVLHDNAVLSREDLQLGQPLSDLYAQVERVKITPQSLSVEEVSKLWTIFQTQYRVSTAYQVSVVLIESTRAARTPPPVLQRGKGDRGINSMPKLASVLPTLVDVALPPGRLAAQLGDAVTVRGSALSAASAVKLSHSKLPIEQSLPIAADATDTELACVIADDPSLWAAGLYSLVVESKKPGELFTRTSNVIALALAPTLLSITPATAPAGADAALTLSIKPAVRPGQRVSVLFGDAEILLEAVSSSETELDVIVPAPAAGTYVVRVRVDGLDSNPAVLAGTPPLWEFAASQQVKIT